MTNKRLVLREIVTLLSDFFYSLKAIFFNQKRKISSLILCSLKCIYKKWIVRSALNIKKVYYFKKNYLIMYFFTSFPTLKNCGSFLLWSVIFIPFISILVDNMLHSLFSRNFSLSWVDQDLFYAQQDSSQPL